MAINNSSTAASVLKLHYEKSYEDACFKNNPTLMMIPKENNWGGTNRVVPVKFSLGEGGGSATFASGSANSNSIDFTHWLVTTTKAYHFASVDGETYNASKIAPDAFLDVSKEAISSALQSMANATSVSLFRDGAGVRGRVAASPALSSSTTLTLLNIRDAKNFEKGMRVVSSTVATGAGTMKEARTVTKVNRSTGQITFDTAFDTGAAWLASDYLYRAGDEALVLKGFDAWLPETVATSGDSFFGVDRAADRERLAGVYYDGSSQQLAEALIDGLNFGVDLGADPDTIIVSATSYSALAKELGSQAIQQNFQKGQVGFQFLVINSQAGAIQLVGDRSCPENVAYCLNKKSWKLCSRGPKSFNIDDRDGNIARLNASADRLDYRFYTYINLVCTSPGKNVRIKLPSVS
jgi:hypothetical protein